MSSNLEWFLSDGTLLSGAEAETYLSSKLYEYADLFDRIRQMIMLYYIFGI